MDQSVIIDELERRIGRVEAITSHLSDSLARAGRQRRPFRTKDEEGGGDDGEEEDGEEADKCCICLERLHCGFVTALHCRHEFHWGCIWRWLRRGPNFCPLCKARAIN